MCSKSIGSFLVRTASQSQRGGSIINMKSTQGDRSKASINKGVWIVQGNGSWDVMTPSVRKSSVFPSKEKNPKFKTWGTTDSSHTYSPSMAPGGSAESPRDTPRPRSGTAGFFGRPLCSAFAPQRSVRNVHEDVEDGKAGAHLGAQCSLPYIASICFNGIPKVVDTSDKNSTAHSKDLKSTYKKLLGKASTHLLPIGNTNWKGGESNVGILLAETAASRITVSKNVPSSKLFLESDQGGLLEGGCPAIWYCSHQVCRFWTSSCWNSSISRIKSCKTMWNLINMSLSHSRK